MLQGYGMTEMSGMVTMSDFTNDIKSPGPPFFGVSVKASYSGILKSLKITKRISAFKRWSFAF